MWHAAFLDATRRGRSDAPAIATLAAETLGYEWDEELDNGSRPAGIVHLSSTTRRGRREDRRLRRDVGIGTATHNLTLYRHNSGALVFGAGTVQWSWGLDGTHDRGDTAAAHVPIRRCSRRR